MLLPLPAGEHPPIQNRRHNASSSTEASIEHNGDRITIHRSLVISPDQSKSNVKETTNNKDSGVAAFSAISSVEESEPSSPTVGPAPNFAEVAPGIYRSSFPRIGNFEHLKTLGLKTILTLVPEEYPTENVQFLNEHGIQHFQIPIPAHKDPFVTIPLENIAETLRILSDRSNHPILIHCNKGKHRTGCIVACYRKVNDWTTPAIIAEYRKYASNKARSLDERFIESFDETTVMSGITNGTRVTLALRPELPTPPSSVKDDAKDDGKDDGPLVSKP